MAMTVGVMKTPYNMEGAENILLGLSDHGHRGIVLQCCTTFHIAR
jgi:hypothetical protein